MKRRVALLVSVILFFASCGGPRIGLRLLKPATYDLPGIKSLAVLDMEMRGSWNFWYDQRETTFEDLAKEAIAQILGIETKRPRPDPVTAYPGSEASDRLSSRLVENGHYTVLDHAAISSAVQKHQLQMPTYTDDTRLLQVGKALNVDALLLGTAKYEVRDAGEWYHYKETIKKKVVGDSGKITEVEEEVDRRAFQARRIVIMDLSYRIVQTQTGSVLITHQFREERMLSSKDETPVPAFRKLPDWKPAVDQMVNSTAHSIVTQIAPHYVYQSREIFRGKSSSMRKAAKMAQHNMFDDARVVWQNMADQGSAAHPKDREAALYNLGLFAETVDSLDIAEKHYQECFGLTGKKRFLNDRSRVQQRRQELQRLRSQDAF